MVSNNACLPPELWLQIFHWATHDPETLDHLTSSYKPFQSIAPKTLAENLRTKRVLVLVCRAWRACVLKMLYEDLRVDRGQQHLREVLKSADGFGGCVRRAEIPYSSTSTETYVRPALALRILEQCPHLEVLVRPKPDYDPERRFEFDANCLPLPSVKRLEWWQYDTATRTGGINSLRDVLLCTPNLQYLIVGGDLGWPGLMSGKATVALPALHTIRFQRTTPIFLRRISQWTLPALTHVVFDTPVAIEHGTMQLFWETFGAQLRTVEFGKSLRFSVEDQLTPMLQLCPQLETVNYHVYFACPEPALTQPHATLSAVGLHADGNPFGGEDWECMQKQFSFLCGDAFPALKKITLYGQWKFAEAHISELVADFTRRGRAIELAPSLF
ncbi:hypothetical protein PLICRDRAFT_35622 [Plicaturopsis crispa FD-325 SS-3]|nr:hypothetical protein PLICRDRAFT_35622 [Plicaturopsis crispa FD-325 SS-3]